ncbi:MAG: hypothetical protein WCI74_00745 [Actinomycetes bacterium]
MHSRLPRVMILVSVLALLLFSATGAQAASPKPQFGLGGGSTVTSSTVISATQGQVVPNVHEFAVGNTGTFAVPIKIGTGTVDGITTTTDVSEFTLEPGKSKVVKFGFTVSPETPTGKHALAISASIANIKAPSKGFAWAPTLSVSFKVDVVAVGAQADVKVTAVNEQGGSRLSGAFTLAIVPTDGAPFVVASAEGEQLQKMVAPGNYLATVQVADNVRSEVKFTVGPGETKDVVIPVKTISFSEASARPVGDPKNPDNVELFATVLNSLRALNGPVEFRASISRDGQQVDQVILQTLPKLDVGTVSVKQYYRPSGGWSPGKYDVVFDVKSPELTVVADTAPSFEIPGTSPLIFIGLAGLLALIIAAIVAFVSSRRRNRPGNGGSGDAGLVIGDSVTPS